MSYQSPNPYDGKTVASFDEIDDAALESKLAAAAACFETGMVFVNSSAVSSPELPFGGVKNSGYGRELSGAGIQEFVNKKLIRIN